MDKQIIKIVCFAGLRKYFGSETSVTLETDSTYSKVIDELKIAKPEAIDVLSSCRIAVNEEFVLPEQKIESVNTLFLIPPSSGG